MKKNKLKVLGVLVLIMLSAVVVWCNFFNPAIIAKNGSINIIKPYIDGREYNSDIFDDLIKESRGEAVENYINQKELVRTNSELPSVKREDYVSIAVDMEVKNISLFAVKDFSATVNSTDADSRILYTDTNMELESVKGISKKVVTVVWMEVYRGDMTDKELFEYLKSQTITVYFENSAAGVKSQRISLNDCSVEWKGQDEWKNSGISMRIESAGAFLYWRDNCYSINSL